MELEALVKRITQEVMKQLEERTASKTSYFKKALFFSPKDLIDQEKIIDQLKEKEITCSFLEKYAVEEIKTVDYIILPTLSVTSLAYIANGIEGDDASKIIIRSKLYGKEVLVLEEGIEHKNFKETSHLGMYQLYEGYMEKLQSLGISIGNLETLFCSPHQEEESAKCSLEKEEPEEKYIEARLLTEKVLKEIECKENSKLCIESKTIVTPMAKDYIRRKKIQIIRR